ncbi:hypothetical protein VTI74DRAFT_5550 [Chaetomium olivicolor]
MRQLVVCWWRLECGRRKGEGGEKWENLLCDGDDASTDCFGAGLDGSGGGRSTSWACKGRTQSAWCENVPYRLLASHFYFASAAADTGWAGNGVDESGDASVVGIKLGCGKKGREGGYYFGRVRKSLEPSQPWRGGGRPPVLPSCCQRRALGQSTCSQEPRGHCAQVSPTRESRLWGTISGHRMSNPNPQEDPRLQPNRAGQWQPDPPRDPCTSFKLRFSSDFQPRWSIHFPVFPMPVEGSARVSSRFECRAQENGRRKALQRAAKDRAGCLHRSSLSANASPLLHHDHGIGSRSF